MRKHRVFFAFLALGLASATAADAQVVAEGSALVGVTWIMAEPPARFAIRSEGAAEDLVVTDAEFATRGATLGATAGVRIDDRYSIEGLFTWVPTRLSAGEGLEAQRGEADGSVLIYGATVIYHFAETGPFRPFFGVGAGAQTTRFGDADWRSETEPMGNLVAGGEIELGRGLSLRLDARNCISAWESGVAGTDDTVRTDAMFAAGLRFTSR
jgi:hypothetical protein